MEMTMNANINAEMRVETHIPRDAKLEAYARRTVFDRPTLIIDTALVKEQYRNLKAGLGDAHIHYAVKANPHPAVISTLVAEGCHFDAASRGEIELVLEQGAKPEDVSFGNTIKRASDIAWAYEHGIRLFAADSEEEIKKIAANAPGVQIYIRLLVGSTEADWPLSRKFGCAPDYALSLMDLAVREGLMPVGISFHVGSQTRHPEMWRGTLDSVAEVWHAARKAGFMLTLLNIGGGFPAFYGEDIPTPAAYAAGVLAEVAERFGNVPRIMAEPGRGLVAEAGMIAAEVLLVSKKSADDLVRWVYLDIGKFSGLAETMDEAIRYQFLTERDDEELGACILAGPSCDSADVLYEKRMVYLPLGLKSGDKFIIRATGAYTSTYSSVGFNGFPPLDVICI
jgi:ornithine decarboxylase